jgi:hypothetical protein
MDLWGENWNPDDINDPGFGVAISIKKQGGGPSAAPQIDNVRITVYYTPPTPLPVVLTRYNVVCNSPNFIEIFWQTASEENNDYFEIQASTNLKQYDTLGRIPGAGTTSQRHNYTFKTNFSNEGLLYFRIVQVDYDGFRTPYPWRQAMCKHSDRPVLTLRPNPAMLDERVRISFASDRAGPVEFTIFDCQGRIVRRESGMEGRSLEFWPALEPGCYLVTARQEFEMAVSRLVIR